MNTENNNVTFQMDEKIHSLSKITSFLDNDSAEILQVTSSSIDFHAVWNFASF